MIIHIELQTRQWLIIFILLSLVFVEGHAKKYSDNEHTPLYISMYQKALHQRYKTPDSAIFLLARSYEDALVKKDTNTAIRVLLEKADVFGHQAKYKNSYDELWKALFLADAMNSERTKAELYIRIGRYYSFYKRRKKALHYFKLSLDINKKLVADKQLDSSALVANYYPFCSTYRELNETELGQGYLDSCLLFYTPKSRIAYEFLTFEKACIYISNKEYAKALSIFKETESWFEANQSPYMVLFYSYFGEAYMGLNNFNESERCYQKSLAISRKYNSHIDFTPIVYENLSDLYVVRGDFEFAYESLKKVKELDAKFFDSRSENNRPLLEIQDAFRNQKKYQQELIQQQKLEKLEHEEDIWFLQRVILIVILTFGILFGILFFSYIRSKHKAEKSLINKQKELQIQKANEVLELKNKELAASTLKLIEKNGQLSQLKEALKSTNREVDVAQIKRIIKSISVSNERNWEEFEARFVAVNESFFKNLTKKFPKLTRGDLKLCALIKLNFSSKEMAQLLGISIESTHTFRYRLRKKLSLSREVNLVEFISSV